MQCLIYLASAQKIQLGNKAFRKELASWVRPNTSDANDGLPGYSFGYSDFESFFGSFIFGTFDMSSSRARIETAYMKEFAGGSGFVHGNRR